MGGQEFYLFHKSPTFPLATSREASQPLGPSAQAGLGTLPQDTTICLPFYGWLRPSP